METKSPTTSVKLREIIGVDQFTQRREVFGKHDTVFLPLPSPTNTMPVYKEVEPIVTSNHAKTTNNFKRNTPAHSSMRESRDYSFEFRPRKFSDNFTSELNQSDDYRRSMTERTRRLSKLRRDFLNSNLHEPSTDSPFTRSGMRASMPTSGLTAAKYKIENLNLHKFPFAEPYSTPPPVRRVIVDLGPVAVNGEKENEDPEAKQEPQTKPRHQSLPGQDISPKVDHQKLFEELVKRYSPQRKPVNWNLPPTRPRVVGSVPKSTSSMADSVDSGDKNKLDDVFNKLGDEDVFLKKESPKEDVEKIEDGSKQENVVRRKTKDANENGVPEIITKENKNEENRPQTFSRDFQENKDRVPELLRVPIEGEKRHSTGKVTDLTIPALLEKMTEEAEQLESHQKENKKVKRKRSFLDKLLGRKKEK